MCFRSYFVQHFTTLSSISSNFKTILYANDGTLLFRNSSYQTLIQLCNVELIKLKNWVESNKLSSNV